MRLKDFEVLLVADGDLVTLCISVGDVETRGQLLEGGSDALEERAVGGDGVEEVDFLSVDDLKNHSGNDYRNRGLIYRASDVPNEL